MLITLQNFGMGFAPQSKLLWRGDRAHCMRMGGDHLLESLPSSTSASIDTTKYTLGKHGRKGSSSTLSSIVKKEKPFPVGIVGRSKPSLSGKRVAPPSWTQVEVAHMRELQEVKKQSLESFKQDVFDVHNIKFKIESRLATTRILLSDRKVQHIQCLMNLETISKRLAVMKDVVCAHPENAEEVSNGTQLDVEVIEI